MFKLKKKKRRNKNIRGQEKKEEEAKDVTTPKAGTNAPDPNSLVPPALKRIFDCKTHFDVSRGCGMCVNGAYSFLVGVFMMWNHHPWHQL